MSWVLNRGPSFNTMRSGASQKMGFSGFQQRFELSQDSNLMTPGKKEPHLKAETTKGTTKLKKSNRKPKGNPACKDSIPKGNPQPIYGGFANVKSKASTRIQKSKSKKLKKQSIKMG